jgi:LysR family nitrogen assimilation transcriptional regulator
MELRQLRYFVGVVEAGSLLKASTRLHIAQPALGQQMVALEAELGAQLFERSSRGMHPTEAGLAFLEQAKVVLGDVERARDSVRALDATPSGEVAIGLPTTVVLPATVPIVTACRERLPQVRLKVIESYSGYLREWLHSGRLDLAVLFGVSPDATLSRQVLLDERLAVVSRMADPRLPARVPLSRLTQLDMVLPSREHGLRRIIEEACAPLGLKLRVVAEIDSLPSVKRVVEAGIGRTVLPLAAVAEEVAAGRLHASTITDTGMTRRVVLASNVSRPPTRAASAVAALMYELIRDMVRSGSWPGRWIGSDRDG